MGGCGPKNGYGTNEIVSPVNGPTDFVTHGRESSNSICKRNGIDTPNPFNYLNEAFPNSTFRFPRQGPTTPHYYKIIPTEFCDESGVFCSSNPSAGVGFPVRWCLRTNEAVQATVPSGKFTSGSNNGRNLCQATYEKERYIYPRYGNLERFEVSPSEYQNYANWYSYYRNRMLTMKTATGKSFALLDDNKRVGLKTINYNSSRFLPIKDFNTAQKNAFFNMLYSIQPSGGTPLREALSRAGRYFAGKSDGINSGMINNSSRLDPVQFSCQKNFSILSTDGYWNGNAG
jgi:type IV pilus assembly protein PilY1